jgi:hypothetical protein
MSILRRSTLPILLHFDLNLFRVTLIYKTISVVSTSMSAWTFIMPTDRTANMRLQVSKFIGKIATGTIKH